MPTIQHKKTGELMPVTREGLKKIQGNPLTKNLYNYPKAAEEPEEITNLKKRRRTQKRPKKDE